MTRLSENIISERVFYIVTAIILLPGIILRFYDLNIDPPQFFMQLSHDLLTDPYNLTSFARNKVLFGEWDIFDYPRWIAFKYSLSSASGYLFFSLFGVSQIAANLSAIFLNLAGLSFFLAALRRESNRIAMVAAMILIPCMILAVYGRFPFLENGLIFSSGLLYFLFTRYYPRGWVLFVSGFLIAICMLCGKMFGIVMLAPILLVLWSDYRRKSLKSFAIVLISWLLSLFILALIFYGEHVGTVYKYLQEQTVGMYGVPEALTSPLRLLENLMTFGSATKLFYFSPIITLMLFAACLALVLDMGKVRNWLNLNKSLLFCIGWLIGGYILLMFPNYRPLRYQLFLMLPIAGIIALTLSQNYSEFKKTKLSRVRWLVLYYISCFFVFQSVVIALIGLESPPLTYKEILPTLLVALLLPLALNKFRYSVLRFFYRKSIFLYLLLIISAGYEYHWLYKWFNEGTHTFQTANLELPENLGENAVIIGPYAQSLTIDNKVKSFIYMFGMAYKDLELFRKYPFTHLAIDASNFNLAKIIYPELEKSTLVAKYWVRDVEVLLSRIDRSAMGLWETSYKKSDYEISLDYLMASKLDSADYYLSRFIAEYPDNRSALLLMPELLIMRGRTDQGFEFLQNTMTLFPNDYSVFLKAGFIYYRAFLITRSEQFRIQSDKAFDRAIELNPTMAEQIVFIKQQASDVSQ